MYVVLRPNMFPINQLVDLVRISVKGIGHALIAHEDNKLILKRFGYEFTSEFFDIKSGPLSPKLGGQVVVQIISLDRIFYLCIEKFDG